MCLLCFKVEGIDLKYSEDADERIKEECCPGKPFVVYRTEVMFTNVYLSCGDVARLVSVFTCRFLFQETYFEQIGFNFSRQCL